MASMIPRLAASSQQAVQPAGCPASRLGPDRACPVQWTRSGDAMPETCRSCGAVFPTSQNGQCPSCRQTQAVPRAPTPVSADASDSRFGCASLGMALGCLVGLMGGIWINPLNGGQPAGNDLFAL